MEEDSDIDINLYKNKLKNEIFCFNDTEKYLKSLEDYLVEGNFYKKNKEKSKEYFVNLNYFQKRDKLLKNALSKIANKI